MKKRLVIDFDEFYHRIKTETPFTTQEKLGKALGIGRSGVSWIKTQVREVPYEWINRLEKHGYSRDWLISGTGDKFSSTTGLYVSSDYLKVRTIKPDLDNLNTKEYYSFSATWLAKKGKPDDLAIVFVDNDDLSPEIRTGDMVMVNTSIKEPKVGKFYALSVQSQFIFRKVKLSGEGFEYIDLKESEGISSLQTGNDNLVKVVGQIVWLGREFS